MMQRNAFIRYVRNVSNRGPNLIENRCTERKNEMEVKEKKKHGLSACTRKSIREKKLIVWTLHDRWRCHCWCCRSRTSASNIQKNNKFRCAENEKSHLASKAGERTQKIDNDFSHVFFPFSVSIFITIDNTIKMLSDERQQQPIERVRGFWNSGQTRGHLSPARWVLF